MGSIADPKLASMDTKHFLKMNPMKFCTQK